MARFGVYDKGGKLLASYDSEAEALAAAPSYLAQASDVRPVIEPADATAAAPAAAPAAPAAPAGEGEEEDDDEEGEEEDDDEEGEEEDDDEESEEEEPPAP